MPPGLEVFDRCNPTYHSDDLHALGLASRVVPEAEVAAEATALARLLAGLPQEALRRMKRTLALTATQDLERAIRLQTDATVAGFLDPETTRRLQAF